MAGRRPPCSSGPPGWGSPPFGRPRGAACSRTAGRRGRPAGGATGGRRWGWTRVGGVCKKRQPNLPPPPSHLPPLVSLAHAPQLRASRPAALVQLRVHEPARNRGGPARAEVRLEGHVPGGRRGGEGGASETARGRTPLHHTAARARTVTGFRTGWGRPRGCRVPAPAARAPQPAGGTRGQSTRACPSPSPRPGHEGGASRAPVHEFLTRVVGRLNQRYRQWPTT